MSELFTVTVSTRDSEVVGRSMSVREAADALGVSPETVKFWIRKLYPGLMRNGVATRVSAAMATEIKKSIGTGRNDLQNVVQVRDQVTTALEIEEMTLKVIAYHKGEADRLRAQVAELAPDAAAARIIAAADGLKTLSQVGKINNIGPRKFIELLLSKQILFRNRGSVVPYQRYIDQGYFQVREKAFGREDEEFLRSQTYVTGRGEVWLAKQFFPVTGPAPELELAYQEG